VTTTRTVELYKNGINLEIGGYQMDAVNIPSGYVPISFAPILGQHALVSGDRLRDGLMVVLGDYTMREDPELLSLEHPDRKRGYRPTEHDRRKVLELSRWALVTDFEIDGDTVSFTAIYADGTMRPRRYNRSFKWAVLLEYEFEVRLEIEVRPLQYVSDIQEENNSRTEVTWDDPELVALRNKLMGRTPESDVSVKSNK
jgi:hypothetical protein